MGEPDASLDDDLDSLDDEDDGGDALAKQHASATSTDPELAQADRALDAADAALRDARRKRDAINSNLKHDLGMEQRWHTLVDECAERKFSEYTYRICYFVDARQGHTRLGRFSGWDTDGR